MDFYNWHAIVSPTTFVQNNGVIEQWCDVTEVQ